MTDINLLPWRELKREQERRFFMTMLSAGGVASIIFVMLLNYYASTLISKQEARNNRLTQEIKILDKQIAEIKTLRQVRQALISRMMIVQNLQSTRILTVHLFDELIKIMPEGIYVTQLERDRDKVTVTGFSQSNSHISVMMRNIERSKWIQQPVLTEIKKSVATDKAENNEFKLNFILKPETA